MHEMTPNVRLHDCVRNALVHGGWVGFEKHACVRDAREREWPTRTEPHHQLDKKIHELAIRQSTGAALPAFTKENGSILDSDE